MSCAIALEELYRVVIDDFFENVTKEEGHRLLSEQQASLLEERWMNELRGSGLIEDPSRFCVYNNDAEDFDLIPGKNLAANEFGDVAEEFPQDATGDSQFLMSGKEFFGPDAQCLEQFAVDNLGYSPSGQLKSSTNLNKNASRRKIVNRDGNAALLLLSDSEKIDEKVESDSQEAVIYRHATGAIVDDEPVLPEIDRAANLFEAGEYSSDLDDEVQAVTKPFTLSTDIRKKYDRDIITGWVDALEGASMMSHKSSRLNFGLVGAIGRVGRKEYFLPRCSAVLSFDQE